MKAESKNSRDIKDLKGRYDDIINLPYQGSNKPQKMSMRNRAAQFAPFAALSGHDEAINETEDLHEKEWG